MSPLKIWFRRLHLWLGLGTGLLLVFVCLTGSVLVFEEELEHAWHPGRYAVPLPPAVPTPRPLADLLAAVRTAKPQAKISGLKVYADPTRTVEVTLAATRPAEKSVAKELAGKDKGGKAGKKGKGKGPRVFVNPYTATITGELDPRDNFFHTVEELHRGLVAGPTGKLVMGINALLFVLILGTGLVLWWPTARQTLRPRLLIKWASSWKRRTHDLHVSLGFYAAVFLLVMALTGVGMSFDWAAKILETVTSSSLKRADPPTSAGPPAAARHAPAIGPDALLAQARQQVPQAVYYSLQLPQDPEGSIRVAVLPPGAPTQNATDEVFLDQYSGAIIGRQPYAQRPLAQRVRSLYKPIHTGAIYGWPTKVLALLISLLGASFPVTGTLMWLNRRKKRRKPQPLQAMRSAAMRSATVKSEL